MPAAARVIDLIVSPANRTTGPPYEQLMMPIVASGTRTVLIGGLPAAALGDRCGADTIATGSPSVLIDGKPAARVTDKTAAGGSVITPGFPIVQIGG